MAARPFTALEHARRSRGLSQQGLADLAGVDRSIVSRLESGAFMPRSRAAEAVADVVDIPAVALTEPAEFSDQARRDLAALAATA